MIRRPPSSPPYPTLFPYTTLFRSHGEPNRVNAHPHFSESENIALVHNGIIENYATVKEYLKENGVTFRSCTDTEVLVQLIEFLKLKNNVDLVTAVQMALNKVVGAYAIVIVERNNPDLMIAARKSSPLVVGINDNEFFVASDASPIIEYTNKVIYLEDGEIAVMKRGEDLKMLNLENSEVFHDITEVDLSLEEIEKGGYPFFMIKEIFEQPKTIKNCLSGRILPEEGDILLSGIKENLDKFLNARRIIIVACGTSWHAGLIGEHLIENFAAIPVEVEYASEFRYRNPIIFEDDVVIAISQSGETADTLAAIELARKAGAFVYGVCNAVGSSIARNTDSGSYIHVGPEIGVASTKAFSGQVSVLSMIAIALAKIKGKMSDQEIAPKVTEISNFPDHF